MLVLQPDKIGGHDESCARGVCGTRREHSPTRDWLWTRGRSYQLSYRALAKAKLDKMRVRVTDEAEVRKLFKAADKDRRGSLPPFEVAKLCRSLGSELDNELEIAMAMIGGAGSATAILIAFSLESVPRKGSH